MGVSSCGPVSPYVRLWPPATSNSYYCSTTSAKPSRAAMMGRREILFSVVCFSLSFFYSFCLSFFLSFFLFFTCVRSQSLSVAQPDVRLCFATSTRRHVVGVTVRHRRNNNNNNERGGHRCCVWVTGWLHQQRLRSPGRAAAAFCARVP